MSARKKKKMQLEPEDYYQWRFAMEQYLHQDTKNKLVREQQRYLQKALEAETYKLRLFNLDVKSSAQATLDAKAHYDKVRGEIETKVGFTLAGKAINEFTFEVTDEQGEG